MPPPKIPGCASLGSAPGFFKRSLIEAKRAPKRRAPRDDFHSFWASPSDMKRSSENRGSRVEDRGSRHCVRRSSILDPQSSILDSVTGRGRARMGNLSARSPHRSQFERERDHQRAEGESVRSDQPDDRKRASQRERHQHHTEEDRKYA